MTQINASCPVCGPVRTTNHDVLLMVCTDASLSYYSFPCPNCREIVKKSADESIISLLMSGGVRPIVWEVPREALEPHSGPPISLDDLIDFGLFLERNIFLTLHV